MNSRPRIGVDIDGVLIDTNPYDFLRFCKDQLGWNIDYEVFANTLSFRQTVGGKPDKIVDEAFAQFLATVEDVQKPIEGAHDALRRLGDIADIYLITARGGILKETTEHFLREHLSDVNYHELSMDNLEKKAQRIIDFKVDYYIDDSYREISLVLADQAIQTRVIPFPSFFSTERWKDIMDERIHWLTVWQEVHELLEIPQQVAIRKKAWEEIATTIAS